MKMIDLQQALDEIPTNWLDNMLTGPGKVIGDGDKYTARDIEKVLQEVRRRIAALSTIEAK